MKPDAVQLRVLGALLEKQRTTPDTYPLTLNALRAACNQSTNRDPVVQYDDAQIRAALEELARRRWTRSAGGSRAAKYRHLLADTMQIRPDEQAVIAVLLLRGPQTPGELRARTERLHRFGSADELETTIDRLITRRLVVRLERRPGQKEGRVQQVMGGDELQTEAAATSGTVAVERAAEPPVYRDDDGPSDFDLGPAPPRAGDGRGDAGRGGTDRREEPGRGGSDGPEEPPRNHLEGRVVQLEGELEDVRAELQALRAELAALRSELGA
ncbi:YceH family protein [Patulibacter sp.]|uniref:YceH family protein n=1 Tax=Patulibacter sp. TaxID=1912859 RepID=UPI002720B751|nr:YceH family protein [Patulibacter sp.]MDO9407765.1 YceH family protein [Patulibacter sp.]